MKRIPAGWRNKHRFNPRGDVAEKTPAELLINAVSYVQKSTTQMIDAGKLSSYEIFSRGEAAGILHSFWKEVRKCTT